MKARNLFLTVLALLLTAGVWTQSSENSLTKSTSEIAEASGNSYQSFTYDVDRQGDDLVVTFNQRSYIRHHTTTGYKPYRDYYVDSGDEVLVTDGQWLEAKIGNDWSELSDADNR